MKLRKLKRPLILLMTTLLSMNLVESAPGDWGRLEKMYDYESAFQLSLSEKTKSYKATLLETNRAGNVFHPGETPEYTIQIENLANKPLSGEVTFEIVHYSTYRQDPMFPKIVSHGIVNQTSQALTLDPKGWENTTFKIQIPETKGGYALIADWGKQGRHYVTSMTRTFKEDPARVQHPTQALDPMPAPILKRIGIKSLRQEIKFVPRDHEEYQANIDFYRKKFEGYHANNVTLTLEFGGVDGKSQPLGKKRAWLDDRGVMQQTKADYAWLPAYDEEFKNQVRDWAIEFGWPKGPITGVMLWNEPWESISISGWQADIPRYREIYLAMAQGIIEAREQAGVDVLIGGCDSTDNTQDKLFGDGRDTFLPYLDFTSHHYHNLNVLPRYYDEHINRKYHQGRVLAWDTESWVANSDDTFAGAIAAMRAAGYDRTLGSLGRIAVSSLSHNRIAKTTIRTEDGPKEIPLIINSRPLAAAYAAFQNFVGERSFENIMFKTGLPWIYSFKGLNNNPDDGIFVVVGDINPFFGNNRVIGRDVSPLFSGVRSLSEVERNQEIRRKLYQTPPSSLSKQNQLIKELTLSEIFTKSFYTIKANPNYYNLYDFYGNLIESQGEFIRIPLDHRGFFLKPNVEKTGSFALLEKALSEGQLSGIEPLDIIVYDMTQDIEEQASFRLRLTNQHNASIKGKLKLTLTGATLSYPGELSFKARERKFIEVKVLKGTRDENNRYLLTVDFESKEGHAVHDEFIGANVIPRITPKIDADISEWKTKTAHVLATEDGAEISFQEKMWAIAENKEITVGGFAKAYLGHDEDYFYFAAQVADSSVDPGSLRYAERDDDSFYYPKVSYSINEEQSYTFLETELRILPNAPIKSLLKDEKGEDLGHAFWRANTRNGTMAFNYSFKKETGVTLYVKERSNILLEAYDNKTNEKLFSKRIKVKDEFCFLSMNLKGNVRLNVKNSLAGFRMQNGVLGMFFDQPFAQITNKQPVLYRDHNFGVWLGEFGAKGKWIAGNAKNISGISAEPLIKEKLNKHVWPEGVRNFSYRHRFDAPWNYEHDNVQIAFNALPIGQDGIRPSLPGNMPRYAGYSSTDHAFVFNRVAQEYGSGYEAWRLRVPGMRRIHAFPREPKHPLSGAVEEAKIAVKYENGFRFVEIALPWSEIPAVKLLKDTGKPVKLSFRVNDDTGPWLDFGKFRSANEGISGSFHPGWRSGNPNEIEFVFEE